MASNGFLKSVIGSAALRKRRGLAPLIPAFTGSDLNVAETDIFTSAFWPGITPKVEEVNFFGGDPVYVVSFSSSTSVESITLTGNVPELISQDKWFFTGRGYASELQATLDADLGIQFTGRGYAVTPEMLGGFIFEGQGYSVTPSLNLAPDYNIFFTSTGYAADLIATLDASIPISFTGRGYSYSPELLGGFILSGRGYNFELSSSVGTSESIAFTGRGFNAGLTSVVAAVENISFTGRGFRIELFQDGFTGRGYAVEPLFSFEPDTAYAEAFVMNLIPLSGYNTQNFAVSRYQNFPFYHLARIGDTYYGINSDGLYELTGEYDALEDVSVNGTIHTHTTDYGIFNSKNVPYVYLNGDDDYSVTAFVDDVEQPAFSSGFSGRRVKLARGNKGRYWEFKIEGIKKLQGIEHLPDGLSRRVK